MALLILDLDETLIFGTEDELPCPPDFSFSRFFIYKRPFLNDFLDRIAGHFDLAVWSTASEHYVLSAAEFLFRGRYDLRFIWDYSRCVFAPDPDSGEYGFVKNLDRVVELGYGLNEILIVDDTPEKVRTHRENAIIVSPFTGDGSDTELSRLGPFLLSIKDLGDLRRIPGEGWRNFDPNLKT